MLFFAVNATIAANNRAVGRKPGRPRGFPVERNGKAIWFMLIISKSRITAKAQKESRNGTKAGTPQLTAIPLSVSSLLRINNSGLPPVLLIQLLLRTFF
jgi:hypothetical protein